MELFYASSCSRNIYSENNSRVVIIIQCYLCPIVAVYQIVVLDYSAEYE